MLAAFDPDVFELLNTQDSFLEDFAKRMTGIVRVTSDPDLAVCECLSTYK